MDSWNALVHSVQTCPVCKGYPMVKAVKGAIAWNGCKLPDPRERLDYSRLSNSNIFLHLAYFGMSTFQCS